MCIRDRSTTSYSLRLQKQPKNPEEAATARRYLSSWLADEQKLIAPRTTVGGQAVEYEITRLVEIKNLFWFRYLEWQSSEPVENVVPNRHAASFLVVPKKLEWATPCDAFD